jgi:hypothetical protein
MLIIHIQENELAQAIEQLAAQREKTVEEIAKDALQHYLSEQPSTPPAYSFIGIGRSGKTNLSEQVDEILAEAADRKEGWRLPE